MLWGVFLKGCNAIGSREVVEFLFEFLPQFVFMCVTFGYMDFLIMKKWLTDWTGRLDQAPGIINTMINMPLKGGSTEGMPLFD